MANVMIREFFTGFVRIHILYHASMEPIFGMEIQRELNHHGYRLGPGTLYPMLHRLAKDGYLERESRQVGNRIRHYYKITAQGRNALQEARGKIRELVSEVIEEK